MITERRILVRNYLNFFHALVNIYIFCILFTNLFAKTKYNIAKYGGGGGGGKLFLK